MVRRFVVAVLIFLIASLVAADRLGAIVAAHVLAGKVQTYEHLPSRPSATIGGIPFLTQALTGHYKDVTIEASNVPIHGLSVTSLIAHLHGVHIPISSVHGSVSQVPVDQVTATAFVAYAAINTYLNSHQPRDNSLSLHPGTGSQPVVVDHMRVDGKPVTMRGVGTVSLVGNVLAVGVTDLVRTSGGTSVNKASLQRVLRRLKVAVPLRGLPFRISLQSVSVSAFGVTVVGGAQDVVLGSHPL